MKALILVMGMVIGSINANTVNLAAVSKALSDGDAVALGAYFDQRVELTIMDKQGEYDKTQATQAVADFFSKNKAKSFNPVHQGSAKGGTSHYTIGDLSANTGNFRVYLYYKSVGERIAIQEMRIEK